MLLGDRSSWVWLAVQNELLGDVAKGCFNRLNSDLSAVSVVSLPDAYSKGKECIDLLDPGTVAEVLVMQVFSAAEVCPCIPALDSLLIIHCCIPNRLPRNVSKMFETRRGSGTTSCHWACCGRGNFVVNNCKKASSERLDVLVCKNVLALEGRDAISAISFGSPATWVVDSGPTSLKYRIRASPLSS